MSRNKVTSAVFKNGVRVIKGLLPEGAEGNEGTEADRIKKLKPKALAALARKILREEKEKVDESPFDLFLPKGNKEKRRVIRHVTRILKKKVYKYLELPVRHNYRWDSESILNVVLHATIRNSCIEDSSNSLNLVNPKVIKGSEFESVPNGDTVLRRIQKVSTLEWMDRFEEANTDLLKPFLKNREFSGFTWLSLDITPVHYYGDKNAKGVMGKKPERGTSYGYKYMDICVSSHPRVTLAGSYMTQLMDHQGLMRKLIVKALRYVHGKVGFYCDREFGTVPYLKVLEEMKVSWVVAIREDKKISKIIKKTKEYPHVEWYVMGTKEKVGFWLILIKDEEGEVHIFGTNIEVDEKTCTVLTDGYRKRWSIETSHRMIHDKRAKTCSKSFSLRWFLVLFSILMRNAYYLLNRIITGIGHVTLKTFAEFLKGSDLKDISDIEENKTVSSKEEGNG